MPKRYKVYRDFSGGINTKTDPKLLKDNELVNAAGVVVDKRGKIRTVSPTQASATGTKMGGALSDMDANMLKVARGLFTFKSDYSFSDTDNTFSHRESEYIIMASKSDAKFSIYGYNDAADQDDHMLQVDPSGLDLGSGVLFAVYYYAEGAVRLGCSNFSHSSNTPRWFGRIGDENKKKLLGAELDRKWLGIKNNLETPTVGFVAPKLSGTASGDTTTLTLTAGVSSSGDITAFSDSGTGDGRTRVTDGSHGLAVGDEITIHSSGPGINGTWEVLYVSDSNNFDVGVSFISEWEAGGWTKAAISDNFQGWSTAISAAASDDRHLVAYDVSADATWKITAVSGQSLTTTTNATASWNGRTFDIYPYPGDGILLEAYQSQSSNEGDWEEGEYEFAQSFVYEGNQESKILKLEGNNIQIDHNQVLYARVHVSGISDVGENESAINQRLIGGRVYTRKSGTNNFWSLLIDMDFRVHNDLTGGGTRISTIDDYDAWASVEDAGTNGENFEDFTDTNFEGFKSKQYTIKRLSIESYENINGFSSSEYAISFAQDNVAGYGYTAAVVAGQRVFVANVRYINPDTGVVSIMGDAIFYTPIGKFDTFPSSYKLNIAGNDGDEFTSLRYSNGILLAFKRNSLFLIDISNPNEAAWRLLGKHDSMGVEGDWSVSETDMGVVWANKHGLFMYSGGKPINLSKEKLSYDDWHSFIDNDESGPLVGWDNSCNKILIVNDAREATKARIFDLDTRIWTKGYDLTSSSGWGGMPAGSNNSISNMITFTGNEIQDTTNNDMNPNGGLIFYGDDATNNNSGTSTDLYQLSLANTSASAFAITTKDDDFGLPNVFKKVYALDIEYITDDSSPAIDVKYEINGDDVPNGSSTALSSNVTLGGSANKDNVNIKKLTFTTPVKCRSISFRISSYSTTTFYFEIVSIAIRYRPLQSSAIATEHD